MPARHVHHRSRFIVTIRDPRGAAVSQYHFWRRHPLLRIDPKMSMDAFIDRFLEGDLYFGDYHQHVLGWVRRLPPSLRPEQVLVLRYEDLVEDKLASVRRIAAFLAPGRPLPEDRVREIAASTDFQTMKQEMTDKPRSFHFNPKVFFRPAAPGAGVGAARTPRGPHRREVPSGGAGRPVLSAGGAPALSRSLRGIGLARRRRRVAGPAGPRQPRAAPGYERRWLLLLMGSTVLRGPLVKPPPWR